MNVVILSGRLTKDLEVRYTPSQTAVTTFTLAVDRPVKQGEEKKADFPRITLFGRQAETAEKYVGKGSKVAIEGRIQTGQYTDKNGNTVYTTDVVAHRIEFLDSKKDAQSGSQRPTQARQAAPQQNIPDGYQEIEEDCPF